MLGNKIVNTPQYQKSAFLQRRKRVPNENVLATKAWCINKSTTKRALDICISFLALLFIFSWLFPLIAVLIKLTSRGPIFFIQTRNGCDDQVINCYKFRTMVYHSSDINDEGKYQQAIENDSRVTKFGQLLRKSSLDELPQIWNVLMGEMSLVGPRPHPIPLNIECENSIENYHLRYLVKPGITGLAQVNGARGGTKKAGSMEKRVEYDIWYINNWSFILDLKIIFKTFTTVISGDKNAY